MGESRESWEGRHEHAEGLYLYERKGAVHQMVYFLNKFNSPWIETKPSPLLS